jgi:acetyl-CoA synthetase (ADP-forming)
MNNVAAARQIVDQALSQGRKTLSEYEAKKVLAAYDIPIPAELLVSEPKALEEAVAEVGYPLVMKGCAAEIAHKTEKNLIRVDIRSFAEARQAFDEIMAGLGGAEGGVLVQQLVSGRRELVLGMTRDPQFGACVMFGLGGIFTEILEDITFRKAPLDREEAIRMMGEIKGRRILEAIRGMEAADTDRLAQMLVRLGELGLEMEAVAEVDINPVILSGSRPVAVDALIVLQDSA